MKIHMMLPPQNIACKWADMLHMFIKITIHTVQTSTSIQDFVVILCRYVLLQTLFHLFLISVHLKNEKIEVIRSTSSTVKKQQQNWV